MILFSSARRDDVVVCSIFISIHAGSVRAVVGVLRFFFSVDVNRVLQAREAPSTTLKPQRTVPQPCFNIYR